MTTAATIITTVLKKIGVLAPGESEEPEDSVDALAELNRILASLSADGLYLHYRVHESFNLVVGDGDYSIGTGGNFDTARPVEIEQAFIRDSASHDHELKIRPISEYWRLGEKTASTRPTRLYYDPTYATGTIYFNTYPSAVEALHLVSQKPLTSLASTDTVSLPGEHEIFLINRLAIEIAPYYGKQISPALAMSDRIAEGRVRARNLANAMRPTRINMPGVSGGSYDINEG